MCAGPQAGLPAPQGWLCEVAGSPPILLSGKVRSEDDELGGHDLRASKEPLLALCPSLPWAQGGT